jgi:predicted lysophospholipase L1 biosynthesis ABC-type transport system permease subunit
MDINLTTPAVLFPAVSLLLLAYTNRFLALASVIRKLHADHKAAPNPSYLPQIANLRWRIRLVRNMQFCGVLSLLLCTICMYQIFLNYITAAEWVFSFGLLAMIASLVISLMEIQSSVRALDLHLQDIERPGTSA